MKTYEFETLIPKYLCRFLVEYSVEKSIENGKPVLESITYDELPISIVDLTPTVSGWINDAIANNYSTVKRDAFDENFLALSKTNGSILGLAARSVLAAGPVTDTKAAEVITDLKKQIKENKKDVTKMIGGKLVAYFETAEL